MKWNEQKALSGVYKAHWSEGALKKTYRLVQTTISGGKKFYNLTVDIKQEYEK